MNLVVRILPVLFATGLLGPAGAAATADAPAGQAGQATGTRLVVVPDLSLIVGPDDPGFRSPRAVSLDLFGNVFVADTGNHRVVHFDPAGRVVFAFGDYGWDVGEFSDPTDVCAREGFRLFVVDEGNERIQEFDIGDSSPEGAVFPFREGQGIGTEALVRPHRMEIDAEGRIYVSDTLSHYVWIFAPTGELVVRLGGPGEAAGQFREPAGVTVGPGGRVYVADPGNSRIQVFDSIGNWTAEWRGPDDDPLVTPTGLAYDPAGRIWVADPGTSRIRALTLSGNELFGFGGPGDGLGHFRMPVDVAVDAEGRVWVVDEEREVVERFRVERVPGGE